MWLLQGSEIPTIVIGLKKTMIDVVWSRTCIKSITMQFFIQNILGDLKKKYKTRGKNLHIDNIRPHLIDKEA